MILKYKDHQRVNEYVLTSEKYNNYYYLVLRLNEPTFKSLLDHKLDGLKAISDNIKIVNSYFDVRDILLVMPKTGVDEINNLIKVDYDDIEQLCANNLSILKRLYDVKDSHANNSLLYQAVQRISYIDRGLKQYNQQVIKLYNKIRRHNWQKFKKFTDDIYKLKDSVVINFDDLVDNYYNLLHDSYTKDELREFLTLIILSFSHIFRNEGEMLVSDKTFIIPDGSYIFIKKQQPDSYDTQSKEELMMQYLPNLKKSYNVKLLPYIYNKYIGDTHKPVFAYIRYLDTLYNK